MSHVSKASCVVTDLDVAAAAALRLGGELRRGQKTYEWYKRWVGDTPMPAGMSIHDMGKCDHAIHFRNARYEVGLVAQSDGSFAVVYDYFDSALSAIIGGENADLFAQAYGIEAAKREALLAGYYVTEEALSNGEIALDIMAGA